MLNCSLENSIIENIASKIVEITKDNTIEGNYIFYLDDIQKISKINCTNSIFKYIEEALWGREEVADIQITDKEIDVLLWGEYI